jgi:hypothetical protein
MADGRSRKAAATKKAAAAKSEARAARPRKVVDAANVQPKMGIADPGLGKVNLTVRVGLKAAGRRFGQTGYSTYKTSSPIVQKTPVANNWRRIKLGARPTKVDPKPVPVRSSTPPKVTNAPPTKTFDGRYLEPTRSYSSVPRVYKYAPRTNPSTSRTTSVLKDPTARWQARQATRIAVGMPIARVVKAGTGRAAKAAATKKKK